MAVPFREWNRFHKATLEAKWDAPTWEYPDDWSTVHWDYLRCGRGIVSLSGKGRRIYAPIIKGHSDDKFELMESAENPIRANLVMAAAVEINQSSPTITAFQACQGTVTGLTSPKQWNPEKVTGRHYDGYNQWEDYAAVQLTPAYNYFNLVFADMPKNYEWEITAFHSGVWAHLWSLREPFFRNGMGMNPANFTGGEPNADGEYCYVNFTPYTLKVYFFEALVNRLSKYTVDPAGGEEVIIYGLGFNNPDAEISGVGPTPIGGWTDAVDFIDFIGLQGQGTTTLQLSLAEFSIDNNRQMTIPSMPALDEGTYDIKLRKVGINTVGNVDSYAGDWRCAERNLGLGETGGRMYQGQRIRLCVGECRGGRGLLTKWLFKNKLGEEVFKWFAQIDTRRPSVFYEGRISGISSLTRQVDDRTGLPSISDMTITLANHDKEISKLLTAYFCKNQLVECIYIHEDGTETNLINLIVDDHDDKGSKIVFKLKDISQKYFKIKIPKYIITKSEYPNAHENALGQPMPEALGLNYYSGPENKGAIKAQYVNTSTYEYLAARGSLHSVTQVYSANVLKSTPADYEIKYKDGGRTYIDFTSDQGTNAITFNCKGYMYADWNSSNGYVQNPAYIIAFLLAFLAEVPVDYLDLISFDDEADYFATEGEGTSGRYVIQSSQDVENALKELLFCYGSKIYPNILGKFKLGRKKLCNWQSDILIFDQIDAIDHAERKPDLTHAVNYVKYQWDFYPSHSVYLGADTRKRQASIDDYGVEIEAQDSPWSFKWTTSEDWVIARVEQELLKQGYGDPKINFTVPISWVDILDVFDNFKYQDPFGPSLTGEGEKEHYYFVERMEIDTTGQTLSITGVDLAWLLRQCIILGDEATLSPTWMAASEYERMFGYLCDEVTGRFADGEPGKLLCREEICD